MGDLDSSSETVVVRLTDEEGRQGIGEADAAATVVRELVLMDDVHAWSRGLSAVLAGRDPFPIRALHAELYASTIWHGRRGLGVHALSAVDVALHDLVGKQLGRPVVDLLGGAVREQALPYATIYQGAPGDRALAQMMDVTAELFERAHGLGLRAVKMEVIWGDLVTDRQLVECIHEGRKLLGDEVALLIDFGYRWSDWRDALWVLSRLEEADLYLAEAALQHDDLAGHRKLAGRVETRIGGAEMAATVHECREWIREGGVDVLQPDVGRCGGLTELRRIADAAELEGVLVIPHGWKTESRPPRPATSRLRRRTPRTSSSSTRCCSTHRCGATSCLPSSSSWRAASPSPEAPGLGVELDEGAVARYRVDP